MDKVKYVAVSTKKFVVRHKVAVAVVATSAVWMKLQMGTAANFNNFLKEHDLFDEFYKTDEV